MRIEQAICHCLAALLALNGCTSPQFSVEDPADHPAHPQATAAPEDNVSETLSPADTSEAEEMAGVHADHTADVGHRAAHDDHATDDPYVCPMHPQVSSTDPDSRCDICGMRLVPRGEVEDR